jgi:hypothetical protein
MPLSEAKCDTVGWMRLMSGLCEMEMLDFRVERD